MSREHPRNGKAPLIRGIAILSEAPLKLRFVSSYIGVTCPSFCASGSETEFAAGPSSAPIRKTSCIAARSLRSAISPSGAHKLSSQLALPASLHVPVRAQHHGKARGAAAPMPLPTSLESPLPEPSDRSPPARHCNETDWSVFNVTLTWVLAFSELSQPFTDEHEPVLI